MTTNLFWYETQPLRWSTDPEDIMEIDTAEEKQEQEDEIFRLVNSLKEQVRTLHAENKFLRLSLESNTRLLNFYMGTPEASTKVG